MIGACDINGFIIEACEVSEINKCAGRGTVGKEHLKVYVEQCLVPILGRYNLQEPHFVVILDNARIHFSARIFDLIKNAGALIILTAPSSLHLNWIEYF